MKSQITPLYGTRQPHSAKWMHSTLKLQQWVVDAGSGEYTPPGSSLPHPPRVVLYLRWQQFRHQYSGSDEMTSASDSLSLGVTLIRLQSCPQAILCTLLKSENKSLRAFGFDVGFLFLFCCFASRLPVFDSDLSSTTCHKLQLTSH